MASQRDEERKEAHAEAGRQRDASHNELASVRSALKGVISSELAYATSLSP